MNSKMLRSMALILIGIMVLMASAANGVEARGKETKSVKHAIETLALIAGANAVTEKGFFESSSTRKRLKQATKKVGRLQKMLPADSKEAEITRLLELVLIKIQDSELDQEEILDLFTQAERLASLLIDLINPPSVSIAVGLQATSIIGIVPPPSGEQAQEAEAMIRFGLTAINGDAYVSNNGILIESNGTIVATSVTSNAALSGDLWVVLEGQTKWFKAEAILKAGEREQFVKMWINEVRWGTNPDEPTQHILKVEFETPEIFLSPTP